MDTSGHRGRSLELISSNWKTWRALSIEQRTRLYLLDQDILSAQISLRDYRAAQSLEEDTRSTLKSLPPFTRESSQEEHIQSALATLISLEDFHSLTSHSILHYAKSFICAMRRIGRVLESLSEKRAIFPPPVAQIIRLTWRKKRTMFENYREPRDAIEHIALEEVKAVSDEALGETGTTFLLYVLGNNDTLFVTRDKSAEVSEKNLQSALDARNEIEESIKTNRHLF